jgi:hypothetical protein
MQQIMEMLAEMNAKLDTSHKMMMAMLHAQHERIMASLGKTEATDFMANPKEMESVMEHPEVPNEEAAVKSSATKKRRGRVQNLAAERHQKRTERTWGNHGSRKKLAAACRKVSRRAKWHGKKGTS